MKRKYLLDRIGYRKTGIEEVKERKERRRNKKGEKNVDWE